jgi:hypothetical protein
MPELIPRQRLYASWALREHDADCSACRKHERCSIGRALELATKPDPDLLPGYAN